VYSFYVLGVLPFLFSFILVLYLS